MTKIVQNYMECPDCQTCKLYNPEDELCWELHRHCIKYRREKYFSVRRNGVNSMSFKEEQTFNLRDIVLNEFCLGEKAPMPKSMVYPR